MTGALALSFFGVNFGDINKCYNKCKRTVPINKDPSFYFSKSSSFEKFARWTNEKQKIAEVILSIIGDNTNSLLDIGAGNGIITKLLAKKVKHLTAIEPSTLYFEELQKKCTAPQFTLIKTSLEDFKTDEKFDVIIASHVFQFVSNQTQELLHIKNILSDTGVFLLIDLRLDCDLWNFYNIYRKDVLGPEAINPVPIDYDSLLKNIFNVKKLQFSPTLAMPSIEGAMSILDFIYNTDFSEIKKESFMKIKAGLQDRFGKGPIVFNLEQIMYICTK
jgi:2-polyprenyl-3-methyl-5-hydroxy-6-metoxy-1,4-benzoquinol methylase